MSSSIRSLVTKGMRESGILEVGGIPDAEEFEEGLGLLQELYSSFFGNELGEQLETVNYGKQGLTNTYAQNEDISQDIASVYAPVNRRYVFNIGSAQTVYLHPNPNDGARLAVIDNAGNFATYNVTLNGNGRLMESTPTVVLNTNSLNREWFYRADLGKWTRVIDLDADDISPLPREFDALFSTALAIRVNPRYGATTAGELTDVLKRIRKQFRNRYRQVKEVSSELGVYRLPSNKLFNDEFSSGNSAFDRGR
jgi:hypothetical protein